MTETITSVGTLDFAVSELEDLEAPGFWDTAAGFATGVVVGGGLVAGGVLILT
ncbi:daptide-type RiPP [Curtobacterium oceanosedimentum]|uniref:daptide-type RiPP n=1 Tax=Curtobacterium oceanosedimentum TaxID=465820 RepID=UPI000ADA39FF|nr:daptide-type RiPP [Curtobacterium oceanosedimentum]